MLITKTPHRNSHVAAIAQANDQLCFFLFADAELEPKLTQIQAERSADYTPQVYPTNPYSERIYVKVSELFAFRSTQINQTLGMSFTFAVEQLLLYIERTVLYWAEINQLQVKITDPIEECLANFYKANVNQSLSATLIKTIKYLRLRRNHYIHLAEKPSAELTKFLKYDAPTLQAHWSSRTSILGLTFTSDSITSFGPDESFTLMKIMRVCLEELDACVARHIDAIAVAKIIHTQLLQHLPQLKPDTTKNLMIRVRKVKKRAMEHHGLNASTEEIAGALGIAI